jgi:hypothetical protein
MPNELTAEYNMANWREATKDWGLTAFYPGILQNETIYLYNTSLNSESWIFNNPEVLASVQRGIKDAAQGRVSKVNLKEL